MWNTVSISGVPTNRHRSNVTKTAMKMVRELEYLSCEERLRELGVFQSREEKAPGTPWSTLQYIKGAYKRAGKEFFPEECTDRMRGHSLQLKGAHRFRLDIRKKFFVLSVVRH